MEHKPQQDEAEFPASGSKGGEQGGGGGGQWRGSEGEEGTRGGERRQSRSVPKISRYQ